MSELTVPVVSLPADLREGDVMAGRYRLEQVIGVGGMGVVVAAHHLELDERVAVKFLSTSSLMDPEAVARFDREIRAAARMKNEHLARVYDAGKLADGGRYMVLEFLDGEDLAARVKRTGPLEPTLAIRYLLQACSAVQEAHGLGIIHRDLKPANLYVIQRADGAEVIKVLDFGVMKRMPGGQVGTETQKTEPGTIVGTPFYTSPEQLRGSANVDARTDIWSLGVTLFELLASVPPFSGRTYPQIIANVLEADPLSLSPIAHTLPPGLEQVVLRCLEKNPNDRYESVADLAVALADTVELDAEQKGLLERIVRHGLVSSPYTSPAVLLTPVAAKARLAGLHTPSTRKYQAPAQARRRLFLVLSVATVSALTVVGFGRKWLPKFQAQPQSLLNNATAAGLVVPPVTSVSAPYSVEAPPVPPEPSVPGSTVSPAKVSRPGAVRNSKKGLVQSPPAASATAVPATSVPSATRKKNPLHVSPR